MWDTRPIDALDAACETHDKCYSSCRSSNKCDQSGEQTAWSNATRRFGRVLRTQALIRSGHQSSREQCYSPPVVILLARTLRHANHRKTSGVRMRPIQRVLRIAMLPAGHALLCFIAGRLAGHDDYNTNWMVVILVDLPFIYIWKLFSLPRLGPWSLIIFGTVWWLCVGIALTFIFEWFGRRRRSPNANGGGNSP